MPNLSFKLHDYTGHDYSTGKDVDYCIGSPLLNSEFVHGCVAQAGGEECEFDISSVGGDLKAGIDMYDAIKAYGKADTRIGAMAASSAGIVAMAGKSVKMSKYGLLMLHKPMLSTGGNVDDIMQDVNLLNIMQGRIAQIYADKSGLDLITINSLINSVTWLTADQAYDLGFIDEIVDYEAEVVNHAIVSRYAQTAPEVYKRVFNKLTITNTTMTEQEKADKLALEKKNTGILTKMWNYFKKQEIKTVTNQGAVNSMAPLNVGVAVTNEDGEDVVDGPYTFKNSEGKEVKMVIKNSVVDAFETESDETDTDEDVQDKAVLNGYSIQVTNKADISGVAKVINKLAADKADLVNKLAEVTNQLQVSNDAVKRDEDAIRATIQSEFTAQGSQRSNTTQVDNKGAMPAFLQKSLDANPMVSNAAKNAKVG